MVFRNFDMFHRMRNLCPDSDVADKRVMGLLHELLSLFFELSVERKSVLCLTKYLGLSQKVHKAFENHSHRRIMCFSSLRGIIRVLGF